MLTNVQRAPTPPVGGRTVAQWVAPRRDDAPGIHHVVARGNNKRTIYEDDYDRTLFCLTVDRVATRHHWRVLAYVLMRNHYHLLLSIGERGLRDGMHDL